MGSTWHKTKTDLSILRNDLEHIQKDGELIKLIKEYCIKWGHWKALKRGKPRRFKQED